MRNILLLFIGLFSFCVSAQTTFAPIGATWTYSQHHAFSPDSNQFVLESISDTIIQGRPFSTLEVMDGYNGCMPYFRYVGTSGDSVFHWNPTTQRSDLLYAFNAAIGSQWTTPIQEGIGGDSLLWTVTDTGSVLIDGISFRTLDVSVQSFNGYGTLSSGILVERLGDLGYLYPWIFGACDGEINGPLRCYSDPDISWLNPQFPQCELATSIAERDIDGMTIDPTLLPHGRSITVSLTDPSVLTECSILVLDPAGRTVLHREINEARTTVQLDTPGTFVVALMQRGMLVDRSRVVVY